MKIFRTVLLGLTTTQALDRQFAMYDAKCPLIEERKETRAIYTLNTLAQGGDPDPNSIDGQLQADDPSQYDLTCMRYCLAKADPTLKNYCCGWYKQTNGDVTCWAIPEAGSLEYLGQSSGHRAILMGDSPELRTLYNFTLTGYVDLGFNELSSSSVNDTITEIEIATYPDGVTKTQVHFETGINTPIQPRVMNPVEKNFFILPSNPTAFAEINIKGTFDTEKAGATTAKVDTKSIQNFGLGYQMFGIGGDPANDQSDFMLLYNVAPIDNVKPIFDDDAFDRLLMEHCAVWILGIGFWCRN